MSYEEKELYLRNTLRYCPDVSKYEKKIKIGQGAFGEVFKGINRENGQFVAMKKILVENERNGFPTTAMREMQILRTIKAENIINLHEVCTSKPSAENNFSTEIYLILEFCEHDLTGILANYTVIFTLGQKKRILQQLFNGINYLHKNQIMHRDLKPSNILMTKTGVLKIADFGSARKYDKKSPNDSPKFTNPVVTLWYRAPELLLGNRNYGPIIDLWAAGCIMGELWTRRPIMMGKDEQSQLLAISNLCGSIKPEVWPGLNDLSVYMTMNLPKNLMRRVIQQFRPLMDNDMACDLLDKLLVLNHAQRLDAEGALQHAFFTTEPLPCDLECTLIHYNTSMFTYLCSQ